MISLRASYETAAINPGPFSSGLRAWSKAGPDAFPFTSLRLLCNAFRWPNQFSYINESPDEIFAPEGPHAEWSGISQGITRDELYWYLVTEDALWYFDFGDGPQKPLPASQEAIVENDEVIFRGRRQLVDTAASHGPKHLSAPARFGNLLLVPAEGDPILGEDFDLLWVWVFSTETLGYLGRFSVKVPEPSHFSWCAISHDGRLMYTSPFSDDVLVDAISVYRLPDLKLFGSPLQPSEKMAIESHGDSHYPIFGSTLIGALPIFDVGGQPTKFGRVQGGCVSPNGHLYISFEKVRKQGEIEDCKGVLGLDLLTGQGVHFISSDRGDEVEGVFVGTDGVHVLHNDDADPLESNQFTISHYAADSADI